MSVDLKVTNGVVIPVEFWTFPGGEAIFKDPITDDGVKKSAVGLLRVDKQEDGNFVLTQNCTPEQAEGGALVPVFRDGNILLDENFETIRARVAEGL